MKDFEEMTFEEKANWAAGELIVSIGEGKFRTRLYSVLSSITLEAYQRGIADAKKEMKKK